MTSLKSPLRRRLTASLALTAVALAALPLSRRLVAQSLPQYTNPVIDTNFADPSVLNDDGVYYAYATNTRQTMPVASSSDLVHWKPLPDAMPVLPPWVQRGRTWAPDVAAIVPGKSYVCYFTGRDRARNTQAIGVAVSNKPTGPFHSDDTQPFVDQSTIGGCIDPSCFTDTDGHRYLVWKNDGNSRHMDTYLWIQPLTPDGLHLIGTPTHLLKQDKRWEGPLIEAPTLWKHDSKYYLFYSANGYAGCRYAIGYAVSDNLTGPYIKPRDTAWVSSTPDVCGPGGEDIVVGPDGKTWMAYHFWKNGPHTARVVSIDPLAWDTDGPHLLGPSRTPQTAPIPLPEPKSGRRHRH